MKIKLLTLLVLGIFCLSSCESDSPSGLQFDEKLMLENYGKNFIKPAFSGFSAAVTGLNSAVSAFVSSPETGNLAAARQKYTEANLAWAAVNAYDFGPAKDLDFIRQLNSFPSQFTKIESAISSGSWLLSDAYAHEIKGLAAIDYLLFQESEQVTLEKFTGSAGKSRRDFLAAVSTELQTAAGTLSDQMEIYADDFSQKTGNDPSSGLSNLVNAYNRAFERCKNQRLGYPMGKNSLDGSVSPKSLEAYYSQTSLALLKTNITELEKVFSGGSGTGLEAYLSAYFASGALKENTAAKIKAQFLKIHQELNKIGSDLGAAIQEKDTQLETVHAEMQKMTVLIKSEMPSALSVAITYQDNDGD